MSLPTRRSGTPCEAPGDERREACTCAGAWVHLPPAAGGRAGHSAVPPHERRSSCGVEVVAPWRSLQCLTPDATQLALGDAWSPEPYRFPKRPPLLSASLTQTGGQSPSAGYVAVLGRISVMISLLHWEIVAR